MINNIKRRCKSMLTNNYFTWILLIFLVIYIARIGNNFIFPMFSQYLIHNVFGRLAIVVAIVLVAHYNPPLGVLIALAYIVTILTIENQSKESFIVESFEASQNVKINCPTCNEEMGEEISEEMKFVEEGEASEERAEEEEEGESSVEEAEEAEGAEGEEEAEGEENCNDC